LKKNKKCTLKGGGNMSVYLMADHHDLGNRKEGILLTEEMFQWPYKFQTRPDGNLPKILVNALTALLGLKSFDSEICVYVNLEEKWLGPTHRCWGRIYLDKTLVVCFSHDTRKENSPFYTLIEWPELDESEDENVKAWTSDQWRQLFISRIRKNARISLKKAKIIADKAARELTNEQKRIAAIRAALK
jgi:hypothetical protein